MCARLLSITTAVVICSLVLPAAGQFSPDKVQPPGIKNDPARLTADTEINGKTLDQWIALIPGKQPSPDRSQTEVAIKSIVLFGPELAAKAAPDLLKELKKHKPNSPQDMSVRTNIPMPLAMILSSQERPDLALVNDTVDVFKKMLRDDQIIIRFRALQALAQMGFLAKDSIPELINLARDFSVNGSWEIRELAAMALGTVGREANPANVQERVVDALLARFPASSEPAVKVRLAALKALTSLGVDEAEKYKLRTKLAFNKMTSEDPEHICRLRAHVSMYDFDSAADKAKRRTTIAKYLEDADPFVRSEAAQGLGIIGPDARDQVSKLVARLSDKENVVVGWSMWALGNIKDPSVLAALERKAVDPALPAAFQQTARDAINEIRGTGKDEQKKGNDKR